MIKGKASLLLNFSGKLRLSFPLKLRRREALSFIKINISTFVVVRDGKGVGADCLMLSSYNIDTRPIVTVSSYCNFMKHF